MAPALAFLRRAGLGPCPILESQRAAGGLRGHTWRPVKPVGGGHAEGDGGPGPAFLVRVISPPIPSEQSSVRSRNEQKAPAEPSPAPRGPAAPSHGRPAEGREAAAHKRRRLPRRCQRPVGPSTEDGELGGLTPSPGGRGVRICHPALRTPHLSPPTLRLNSQHRRCGEPGALGPGLAGSGALPWAVVSAVTCRRGRLQDAGPRAAEAPPLRTRSCPSIQHGVRASLAGRAGGSDRENLGAPRMEKLLSLWVRGPLEVVDRGCSSDTEGMGGWHRGLLRPPPTRTGGPRARPALPAARSAPSRVGKGQQSRFPRLLW